MSELVVRQATTADLPEVLRLLGVALGRDDDPRFDGLFRWKHLENSFGASPAWVAVDGSRIAAVRYLMRWEFERAGKVLRAVRAVDTATHPDYQGKGLFTRLTLGALDDLAAEGVDFVFNTPNEQSRPGYLKMGWHDVGRLPIPARPLTLRGLVRMARARVPADHFSADSQCCDAAADVLADESAIQGLLEGRPQSERLRTHATLSFLRWRYGGDLVRYRSLVSDDGLAIFRVRRRGAAREAALALVLSRSGRAGSHKLVRAVLRAVRAEADYAVAIGDRPLASFVALPKAGPRLTWRAIGRDSVEAAPDLGLWNLTLGDIELF